MFILLFLFVASLAAAKVEVNSDLSLPALQVDESRIKTKTFTGRVYRGSSCEFIRLCNVSSNTDCDNGDKFVIKQVDGVRKQFLILNGQVILAFATRGIKFGNCSTFTEVTMDVDCKAVDGAADIDLSGRSSLFWEAGEEWKEMMEGNLEIPVVNSEITDCRALKGSTQETRANISSFVTSQRTVGVKTPRNSS